MSSNWLAVSEGSSQRKIGSNTEAVCSDENVSVDIVKMKHAHTTTGHQALTQAGTLAAAASAPESPANGEQGADCATAGIPPLGIDSFSAVLHLTQRVAIRFPSFHSPLFHAPLLHSIVRRFFCNDYVMH